MTKLQELLQTEEYRAVEYQANHNQDFEDLNDYGGISHLFDELKKELKRVPSQQEYISAGLVKAEEFFEPGRAYIWKRREHANFNWDEDLQASVKHRLARTYRSLLIEESVVDYVRSRTDLKCASSSVIDMTFGADLVVMDTEQTKLYYIHIMSRYGVQYYREKGFREPYIMDTQGKKRYWKRNWGKAHMPLVFQNEVGGRMQEVNGNLVFKQDWLEEYFEDLIEGDRFEEYNSDAEFIQFYEWTVKYKIKL